MDGRGLGQGRAGAGHSAQVQEKVEPRLPRPGLGSQQRPLEPWWGEVGGQARTASRRQGSHLCPRLQAGGTLRTAGRTKAPRPHQASAQGWPSRVPSAHHLQVQRDVTGSCPQLTPQAQHLPPTPAPGQPASLSHRQCRLLCGPLFLQAPIMPTSFLIKCHSSGLLVRPPAKGTHQGVRPHLLGSHTHSVPQEAPPLASEGPLSRPVPHGACPPRPPYASTPRLGLDQPEVPGAQATSRPPALKSLLPQKALPPPAGELGLTSLAASGHFTNDLGLSG